MRTFIVDAFTNKPYTGNPAGVCISDAPLAEELMQKIAREVNHSETAFVTPANNSYSLRWFTPTTEVNLCGHATLSTAHIMYETGIVQKNQPIEFNTKSGILHARYTEQRIELDFPQLFVEDCSSNEIIEKAFGIEPIYVGKSGDHYLIEIDSTEQLKKLKPNFQLLLQSDRENFMITARGHDDYDFHSRFFAPAIGIDEDPVTGSAHCYLAPYWRKKLNKTTMLAFQSSERSGEVECELIENNRILLRGNALTMNEFCREWISK